MKKEQELRVVEWENGAVVMIDQRLLPTREKYNRYKNYRQVASAIKEMVVRGAPAIGVAAAMGCALGALKIKAKDHKGFVKEFDRVASTLAATRPTAVNLFWAIERMRRVVKGNAGLDITALKKKLVDEALLVRKDDIEINKKMGRHGARLLKKNSTVLTHCNAGALATAGYGTALGVIRAANEAGKNIKVFADETRPFLQGARLTAWELHRDGIDVTLITDNMAGWMMKKGLIDSVVVGADRIAANGDTANKIGTYSVALLAAAHKIPFYVAAPTSTIDRSIKHGDKIPIEERSTSEVTSLGGRRVAPVGVDVRNPAFDVTPSKLVTAIITEKGVATRPYKKSIAGLFK